MRITLLSLVICITASSLARSGDPPLPRAIPVFRLQCDIFEGVTLNRQFQAVWGDDAGLPDVLEISGQFSDEVGLEEGWQILQQFDLCKTGRGYVASVVVPRRSHAVLEESDDVRNQLTVHGEYAAVAFGKYGDRVFEPDSDDYDRFRQAYAPNLRAALQHVADSPTRDVARFDVFPARLKATFVRPRLEGLLASALTWAQRGDDEPEAAHAVRSAGVQFLTDLAAMCLSDLDLLSVGFRRGATEGTVQASFFAEAHRNSELHAAMSDFGEVRNRSLSYLHPGHEGFLAITLPLPDKLAEALAHPYFANFADSDYGFSIGGAKSVAGREMRRVRESVSASQKVELLVQTLPCADGSTATVFIIPLRAGSAGDRETTGIRHAAYTQSDSEIDGHPVYLVPDFDAGVPEHSYSLRIVETDHCVAAFVGTEPAQSLFRGVIQRDFEEPPGARRFSRSAVAIDMPLSCPILRDVLDIDLLPESLEDGEPLQSRMTLNVSVDGPDFTITADFEKHATLLGCALMELPFSALEAGLESLTD